MIQNSKYLLLNVAIPEIIFGLTSTSINKNGVLWSQTRMRIEMRLRCYFGHLVIGNWQFVFGNF